MNLKNNYEKIQLSKHLTEHPPGNLIEFIHKILSDENERVRFATEVAPDDEGAASMLNISLRTYYRKTKVLREIQSKEKDEQKTNNIRNTTFPGDPEVK